MTLLTFSASVKLVGRRLLHDDPSLIERAPARTIGPAAEPRRAENGERDDGPETSGREPGQDTVPATDAVSPGDRELAGIEARGALQSIVEGNPAREELDQRLEGPAGVSPRELEYGGHRKRIGCFGGGCAAPERAVELGQLRHCAPHHRHVERERVESIPFAGGKRGIAFVEPQWSA